MKLKIYLTLFLISIGLTSIAQEMSFEEYNPKSTLVTPEHPTPSAKFKWL